MLDVYTVEQSERWDAVVRSFADYDVYWLSGYVKAFKLHGDGEPLLFFYEGSGVRGINVVMCRDVAKEQHFIGKLEENTYFDFSSPYGYGGWLIEGENTTELFRDYEEWCQKRGIVCEFVRFHPVVQNQLQAKAAYEVVPLGETVAMDLESPEVIWTNIISKNRNMIRKAKKNGVKIYCGRNPELFKTFIAIYNATMDKDHADKYYYFSEDFYSSILNDLPYNAQIFYAVWEEKIIAAAIMLEGNRKMNYHLSGSIKEYSYLAPSNLLLYEAALWGWANGYKTLYLGGGVGSGEDSLFKFKRAFYRGENLNRFHIGKKIMNQDLYDKLVLLRDDIHESNYFPKYRA